MAAGKAFHLKLQNNLNEITFCSEVCDAKFLTKRLSAQPIAQRATPRAPHLGGYKKNIVIIVVIIIVVVVIILYLQKNKYIWQDKRESTPLEAN